MSGNPFVILHTEIFVDMTWCVICALVSIITCLMTLISTLWSIPKVTFSYNKLLSKFTIRSVDLKGNLFISFDFKPTSFALSRGRSVSDDVCLFKWPKVCWWCQEPWWEWEKGEERGFQLEPTSYGYHAYQGCGPQAPAKHDPWGVPGRRLAPTATRLLAFLTTWR